MDKILYYESPLGFYKITANKGIKRIEFAKEIGESDESSEFSQISKELDDYFSGKLHKFTTMFNANESNFKSKVYDALIEIPYGTVETYKDVAIRIGNEKASRAVGNANNKNPLVIVVPCHRVVGKSGLVGYAGGVDIKIALLNLESGKFKWIKIPLNGIDFEKLKKRASDFPIYEIYENAISYILNGDRVNIRYSSNALYVNFTSLDESIVKKDIIKRFGLDIPYDEIEEYFSKTKFEALFDDTRGYREVYMPDLYSSTILTIIHQFLSMKAAYAINKRFIETFGEKIHGMYSFPKKEIIAKLSAEEIKKIGLTETKANCIKKVAETFLNNENVNLKMLREIKGIGRWTIENLELFSLREQNVFPVDDVGLQEGIKRYLKMEERPTSKELDGILDGITKYRSFITIHIWAFLMNH